ncbi:MAG: zinc ABC transporter substrate-binding protein, partial [Clostridiales bacterium]|nr:zinc ABC transporter substrate-binding protein [Clostridiales bacterium]
STADVIIINGGGLEGFLEDIIKDFPALIVIDSSKNINMLEYGNNDHSIDEDNHEHEDQEHDDHVDNGREDDHAGEGLEEEQGDIDIASDNLGDNHNHGDYNPHIWLDPQIYIRQIENVKEGLVRYIEGLSRQSESNSSISELSTAIERNANSYIKEVSKIDDMLSELTDQVYSIALSSGHKQGVAIFHDSFAYLANRIGLEVEYSIEIDAETALSSSNIRDVIELVNDGRVKYLLADVQYGDTIANRIESESEAKVTLLDTIVTGDGDKSSYIKGMEENIKLLQALIE